MSKVINFDEYILERKKKSPKFTLFGNEYTLPPSIPYRAVLYLQALNKREKGEQVNDEDILHFFELLLGKETIKDWNQHTDFDVELIVHIMGWIVEQYGLVPKQEKAEKKDQG